MASCFTSAAAPAKWSLEEIVCFWQSGESSLKGGEDDCFTLEVCTGYMRRLIGMGVQTRLQAQSVLTDELCKSLGKSGRLGCDERRHLLDLLGVKWRQHVASPSEIAMWESRPVEPTDMEDDEAWQEEKRAFQEMMLELGLVEYSGHFHHKAKCRLLGRDATARNLLYYICDADFDEAGVPVAVRRAVRTESLRRLKEELDSTQEVAESRAILKANSEKGWWLLSFEEKVEQLREWLV